jgi:hypothetical protein
MLINSAVRILTITAAILAAGLILIAIVEGL